MPGRYALSEYDHSKLVQFIRTRLEDAERWATQGPHTPETRRRMLNSVYANKAILRWLDELRDQCASSNFWNIDTEEPFKIMAWPDRDHPLYLGKWNPENPVVVCEWKTERWENSPICGDPVKRGTPWCPRHVEFAETAFPNHPIPRVELEDDNT